MAEVTRVLREMQLDSEGGLVRARGGSNALDSRRRSKHHVKEGSAAVGVTKAGRMMAVVGNKDAASSFTGEIGVNKAGQGNKEAAGCFTGEIGITKAGLGNKDAAGIFTSEIGVNKVGLGNKDAAGIFASEIGVTKAGLGNKDAAGIFASEIGVTKAVVGKERVPEAYITRIKTRPLRKIPPLSDELCDDYADDPRFRQRLEACFANINYLVDMEQDCLSQHAEKGYAEIGVDYTGGVKKVSILPRQAS